MCQAAIRAKFCTVELCPCDDDAELECGDDGGDGVELLGVPLHAATQVHHELVRNVLNLSSSHHNLQKSDVEKVLWRPFF